MMMKKKKKKKRRKKKKAHGDGGGGGDDEEEEKEGNTGRCTNPNFSGDLLACYVPRVCVAFLGLALVVHLLRIQK